MSDPSSDVEYGSGDSCSIGNITPFINFFSKFTRLEIRDENPRLNANQAYLFSRSGNRGLYLIIDEKGEGRGYRIEDQQGFLSRDGNIELESFRNNKPSFLLNGNIRIDQINEGFCIVAETIIQNTGTWNSEPTSRDSIEIKSMYNLSSEES